MRGNAVLKACRTKPLATGTKDSPDSDEAEPAAASSGHRLQRTLETNALLPEQMDALLQGAANLADAAAIEAGEDLLRRLLDDWLAHPQEPAIVGVPDDLLARAADTVITHTRKAVTAVRQLAMLSSHAQTDIDAARVYTDMLLALPALLLRPAKRPGLITQRRHREEQYSSASPAEPSSDEAAYPQGKDSISFSAILRRRLQKAEKGELAELLHEAIRERDDEAKRKRPSACRDQLQPVATSRMPSLQGMRSASREPLRMPRHTTLVGR